jgi:hypothetical protein
LFQLFSPEWFPPEPPELYPAEQIIVEHFDVEGDSMKGVKRVIHNTRIV